MSAIQHREDAEWPFLRLSWLGYPDPSGRLWFDGLVVAQALHHDETVCRFDGFHPINTSRAFSLVVLRHLSYRKGTGSLGFHQKSLQTVNGFLIATLRGSIDLFLQSVHLPCQLAPGDRCPVFDWL